MEVATAQAATQLLDAHVWPELGPQDQALVVGILVLVLALVLELVRVLAGGLPNFRAPTCLFLLRRERSHKRSLELT